MPANRYLGLSLLCHSAVLLLLVLVFENKDEKQFINRTVKSYTYALSEMKPSTAKNHLPTQSQTKPIVSRENSNFAREKIRPLPQSNSQQSVSRDAISMTVSESKKYEKPDRELLKILHEAIAENQFYPASALELKQEGTATIGFLLHPDGRLSQVTLLKSSGFEAIDSAALSAVSAITTIKEAGTYLQRATFFSLDMIFQYGKED